MQPRANLTLKQSWTSAMTDFNSSLTDCETAQHHYPTDLLFNVSLHQMVGLLTGCQAMNETFNAHVKLQSWRHPAVLNLCDANWIYQSVSSSSSSESSLSIAAHLCDTFKKEERGCLWNPFSQSIPQTFVTWANACTTPEYSSTQHCCDLRHLTSCTDHLKSHQFSLYISLI